MPSIFSFLAYILVIVGVGHHWLKQKEYLFSHEVVAEIARKHIPASDKDLEVSMKSLVAELQTKYPGHILPTQDLRWSFMNSAGWMASICILHASSTEYVALFGTAMETSGHSGRYFLNISDTLLSGKFLRWKEGEFHSENFTAGDTVYHLPGEASGVHWTAGTYMVEYGRGFLMSSLPTAFADAIFSTHDFLSMFQILLAFIKANVLECNTMLQNFARET